MARRRKDSVPPSKKSPLTAAGRRIKRDPRLSESALFGSLARSEAWQELAWAAIDTIGEHGYTIDFFANVLSRLELFPAVIPEGGGTPLRTDDALAVDALDRLRSGAASHAHLLHELSVQFEVPGDCYLVGLAERETRVDLNGELIAGRAESWEIRSLDEVVKRNGQLMLVDSPSQKHGIVLNLDDNDEDADFLARLWIPHSRFRDLATSSSRRVLDTLELLGIMQRSYRALYRQRLSRARLVAIPLDHSDGLIDETTGPPEEGKAHEDPLTRDLHLHFVEPVGDEAHPASVSPFIYRYPRSANFVDHGIADIDLSSPLDDHLVEQEKAALTRYAQGMNAPVEVVFGLSGANHWGGGEIKEGIYRDHIEPRAVTMVDAITQVYYRPSLIAAGVSPEDAERFVVWFDASNLVTNSDKPKVSAEGVRLGAIGHSAWRRVNSFTEDDKPTDEEIDLLLKVAGKNPDATRPEEARPKGPDEAPGDPPPVVVPEEDAATVSDVSQWLFELDQYLFTKLQTGANAAMAVALNRAGAKVVNKLRRDKPMMQVLVGVPQRDVVRLVGQAKMQAMEMTPEALVAGSFAGYVIEFADACSVVADKALGLVPNLDPERMESARTVLAHNIREASGQLEGDLESFAAQMLLDGCVVPDEGEYVQGTLVPPSILRHARAIAAGSGEPRPKDLGLGIATGGLVGSLMAASSGGIPDLRWVYGVTPRRSHESHLELDGCTLSARTSDVYPGDHEFCVCMLAPSWPDQQTGA